MKRDLKYFDINAADYSPQFNALLAAQRKTYEADKAARAALVAQARSETQLTNGDEIVSVHFTRWGQLQVSVAEKATAKPKVTRETLAQYLERTQR